MNRLVWMDELNINLVARLNKNQFINREQRFVAWRLWQSFVEQLMLLDEVGEQYEAIYKNADEAQI